MSFFNLRRDWIWLLVIPGLLFWILSSEFGWFGREEFTPLKGPALQFVGTWVCQSEQLDIAANGSANYLTLREKVWKAQVSITPAAIVLTSSAGPGGTRRLLSIDKAPHHDGGRTIMKLDGRVFEQR